MTLQEAAYNVLNLLVGGRSTNNEFLSPRQIKFNIRYYRALFIRRDSDRFTRLLEMEQELSVTMEAASFTNSGTFPAGQLSDVTITPTDIPKWIRIKPNRGISFVGDNDGVVS